MREYIVSGIPLRDPVANQYFIDYTASQLFGNAARTVASQGSYGFHGDGVEVDNYFESSRETLVLNILGDTKEEHNQLFRGFNGLFSRKDFSVVTAPQRSPLAAGSGRTSRSFDVSQDLQRSSLLRAIGNPAVDRVNEKTARVTWILENIWGFYRSLLQYTTPLATVGAASATADISTTTGDSHAPITDCLVRIRGPLPIGGYVRVYDAVSGKGIGFKATVALLGTEYVIIDCLTGKASKVTSDTWTGGTDVTARVELMGEGGMSFDPGAPASTWPVATFAYGITVTSGGFTVGQTAYELRLRRSYLS
jgi:hypothetical protein